MSYKHFSYEERVKIEGYLEDRKSKRAIARLLGRSVNSICYEISANKVAGAYTAKKAQHKAYQRRYYSKRSSLKVVKNKHLQMFVYKCLTKKWSPERISGTLRRFGVVVSSKAIYKYIRHRSLEYYLFWGWNTKRRGRKRGRVRRHPDGRIYIEQRPPVTTSRHYEADFIVSRQSSYALLVVVDIHTRKTHIRKIPNRKHATVLRVFRDVFKNMIVRSLTLDNDIAFNSWKEIERHMDTTIFFTHPYCSQEKGLVENTNRWIRCFIPKKRNIKDVSLSEIKSIQYWLNHTPRQCLGFKTACEVELEE